MAKQCKTMIPALAAMLWAGSGMAGDVRVIDGDSMRLGAVQIRIFGIDAPELSQRCSGSDGGSWDCGRAAKQRLSDLVAGQPVRCRPQDRDRYGRLISVCSAGGIDLGGQLVAEGLARAYVAFSDAYATAEAEARAGRRGLWQGVTVAPWEYRAEEKKPSDADGFAPASGNAGCAIKGNISSRGDRIYHRPGDAGYARTRIDTARGEAWFCDEGEAQAAGFRPPRSR